MEVRKSNREGERTGLRDYKSSNSTPLFRPRCRAKYVVTEYLPIDDKRPSDRSRFTPFVNYLFVGNCQDADIVSNALHALDTKIEQFHNTVLFEVRESVNTVSKTLLLYCWKCRQVSVSEFK